MKLTQQKQKKKKKMEQNIEKNNCDKQKYTQKNKMDIKRKK